MSESAETVQNEEVDLLDLAGILFRRKWIIIGITGFAMLAVLVYSVVSLILPSEKTYLPNKYTPHALMLINDESSSGGGMASMLSSSGLGGLASMAGVSVSGGSTYSALAIYLTGTNSFLDAVVDKFDLISRYKIKKYVRAESRKALGGNISASIDEDSGVFSLSFTDRDPAFARDVVNYCVYYLENRFDEMGIDKNRLQKENLETNIQNTYNEILRLEAESQKLDQSVLRGNFASKTSSIVFEATRIKREITAQESVYTQLKTQYELLKVTMASESPVFQVLEMAEVPDQKSGPSRGMLCVIVTIVAFFASIFLSFALYVIEKISKDPSSIAKLQGLDK